MRIKHRMPSADTRNTRKLGWFSFLVPVLLVVSLFVVILVSTIGTVARTTAAVQTEVKERLSANARIIDGKIEDMFASIESVAPIMAFESGYTQAQMLQAMNALRDANGFDFVVRTDTNGIAFNYLGKENIDLSQRTYIHKALSGVRAVEYISSGAYDKESPFIIMAVPIVYNATVAGVLHGSYKTENFVALLENLSAQLWQGCDEISIVTDDGMVLATSGAPSDAARLAAIDRLIMHGDMRLDDGAQTVETNGVKQTYYVEHLAAETDGRWHIMARMEQGYLTRQTSYVLRGSLLMVGISVCIAIILISIIISRQKLTMELDNRSAQLSDALAATERAGAAKSQFLSRVSHEMRTPLNAIIGFIELAKGADKEDTENYLASSDLAAKQLLNVINDVLDMSSIESGKLKIANAPFNFRHLIASITNIYGTQCKQKGLIFETKMSAPVDDWLAGDELRVNQILMNLLSNAVKFTARGSVHLTIAQLCADTDRLFLRFTISDTGCGMSEDMQARLFKPFEQESVSTARKYGGSGLGLSIVKNLVGMMDGSIQVQSTLGEGTSFIVDLPFGTSAVKGQNALPDKVGALRVLAVDDEEAERDYIGAVLKRMGVRYTCVASGGEALDTLAQAEAQGDRYNVCLVDWRMPGLDGVDTTGMIRRKYGKDVVVIVASAYDFQQVGDSAKRAGANLFVSKPIFQSSLFDLLMTLTDGEIAKTSEESGAWDFAGKRVLLAEDHVLNQVVAKGYLAKYNVVVDLAQNGQIALDMFTASEPGYYDAILMDIQMPVMDGFEATKAIRASNHPQAKTIPIIAQSADAFDGDIAKSLSMGMNAHIAKPFKPKALAKALNDAFTTQR